MFDLDEIGENLVDALVSVYQRVDWKRISKRSIATDVFSHKLKVSGNMPTVERMLEKLSYSLGVQSIFIDSNVIKRLKDNEDEVLRRVREETVYYTLLTMEKNKEKKGKGKKKSDNTKSKKDSRLCDTQRD